MSKYGCKMKGILCSAFMYADDLVLLSPSVYDLQTMIKVCCNELRDINLNLNIKKSSYLRIGKIVVQNALT